jgi:hypothetical protein
MTSVETHALLASTNLTEYLAAGGAPREFENQRICERLVPREVIHCISSVVFAFLEIDQEHLPDSVDYDELLSLCTANYEGAIQEWLKGLDRDELVEFCEDNDLNTDSSDGTPGYDRSDEDLRQIVQAFAEGENAKEFCSDHDVDLDYFDCEVLEYWAVSSWFAGKLSEHNEVTGELLDFYVWGRTCSGQSISQDGVIIAIAAEMQILAGQKHSWAD